jgi:putative adenylate-forming enzyme
MSLAALWRFVVAYVRTRRHLRWSRRRVERQQEKLFRRLVRSTLTRSPWLASMAGQTPLRRLADLERFPVLDKAAVLEHFQDWNRFGLSEDEALRWGNEQERSRRYVSRQGLSVGLSTGTTGRRGIFMTTAAERAEWAGSVLARFLPGFWKQRHRVALFLRSNSPLYETLGSSVLRFQYFDLMKPIARLLHELEEFAPTVLFAPPSVLELIARARVEGTASVAPSVVISGADVLEPPVKTRLESVFGVPVRQIYQATEGFLAFTCPEGNLHLNEDDIHFRWQTLPGGGRAVPVITDLRRTTQPIVNYRLNDVLVEGGPCRCGCAFKVVAAIEGREDDVLCVPDGRGALVPVFPDFIRRAVGEAAPRLEHYRVVQTGPEHLAVYADVDHGPLRAALTAVFRDRGLPPPVIGFSPFEPPPLNEKRRRVRREFPLPPRFWESQLPG